MLGQIVGFIPETSKVDDSLHALLGACRGKVLRGASFQFLEIFAVTHRVDEIVRSVHAAQSVFERSEIKCVADRDFDIGMLKVFAI